MRSCNQRGWNRSDNGDRFKRMMSEGKVVAFDIFDTALRRKVATPTHLFYVMERMLSPRLSALIPDFAQNRIAAESEAWRRARQARPARQIALLDILAVLQEKHSLTQEDVTALYDLELETENRFTYADPAFIRLHAEALALGLQVIFLSDMYLPSSCLKTMLQHHGFSNPKVFVSSEEGGNKASGQLYWLVAKKMGYAPADFLHLGDKYFADYLRARLAGWRAVHVWNSSSPIAPTDPGDAGQIPVSIGQELIHKNKIDCAANRSEKTDVSFWNDFGYELAGPVYFYFIQWLCQQAARDGISRLLLCSRDGFPLLRGFEILREKWKIPLKTHYFFASRRLFNLATIREFKPADIDFLLMPNPGLKLRDFVERLGLDPKAQAPVLLRLGFTSLDQQLVHSGFGRFIDPAHRHRLERWLDLSREELRAQAEKEREIVHDYFRQIEPGRSDTAVVDVGWKATVCLSMMHLVREIDPNIRPRTYFFGTYENARKLTEAGARLDSFLFHLGEPRKRKNIVVGHEGIVEMLFHAPHGSLRGLSRGPNGIEPVYGFCEYDESMLQLLGHMTTGAHRFIEDMADLLPLEFAFEPASDEIAKILTRLTRHPTQAEAVNLGKIPYRVSYGDHGATYPLAETATKPCSLQADLLAYEQAPWKEGYLAQAAFGRRIALRVASFVHAIFIALTSKTLLASLRWALFKS